MKYLFILSLFLIGGIVLTSKGVFAACSNGGTCAVGGSNCDDDYDCGVDAPCYCNPTPRPQATSTPRPDPTTPPPSCNLSCGVGCPWCGCNTCTGECDMTCDDEDPTDVPTQPTAAPSPTPTPTPTPLPWYKLNKSSFHSNGTLSNSIPPLITPFDSSDSDETTLIIGGDSVGLVSAYGTIDVSPGTVSQPAWSQAQYQKNEGFLADLTNFIQYARARKKVSIITSLDDIQSNTVNIYERDLELSDIASDKKNFVLIVQGDIVIPDNLSHSFNPEKRSMAIIATGSLSVHHMLEEIHGILIAHSYDLGYGVVSSENPLKITGNLISQSELVNTKRERTDRLMPSVYIIFDAQMYEDLIPHLSTILLQRRELE